MRQKAPARGDDLSGNVCRGIGHTTDRHRSGCTDRFDLQDIGHRRGAGRDDIGRQIGGAEAGGRDVGSGVADAVDHGRRPAGQHGSLRCVRCGGCSDRAARDQMPGQCRKLRIGERGKICRRVGNRRDQGLGISRDNVLCLRNIGSPDHVQRANPGQRQPGMNLGVQMRRSIGNQRNLRGCSGGERRLEGQSLLRRRLT